MEYKAEDYIDFIESGRQDKISPDGLEQIRTKQIDNMNKEFIPYEQALDLKELGFDEPCLAFWDGKNTEAFYFNNKRDASGDYGPFQKNDRLKWFGAPLYQQAFRFFREKHKLAADIRSEHLGYYTSIVNRDVMMRIVMKPVNIFETYEEAELECLKKLIEIIKTK